MAKWTVQRRSALYRDGVFQGHLSGLIWGLKHPGEKEVQALAKRIVALLNADEADPCDKGGDHDWQIGPPSLRLKRCKKCLEMRSSN